MTEAYVCKVTRVGQITLPKEMREELNIKGNDYITLEKIGGTYFIKKLRGDKDLLEKVRTHVKKSGITRDRMEEIIEEEFEDVWEKHQGLPRC